jgi:hypothetical protein
VNGRRVNGTRTREFAKYARRLRERKGVSCGQCLDEGAIAVDNGERWGKAPGKYDKEVEK